MGYYGELKETVVESNVFKIPFEVYFLFVQISDDEFNRLGKVIDDTLPGKRIN